MRLYRISLLILLVFGGSIAFSQSSQTPKSLKKFDEYVNKTLTDFNLVGAGVAIVKDGELIYAKGFGSKDIERTEPVDEHTLFAIGSSSKAFTAAAVCKLAEDGLLDLDKPILEYLPDFRLYDEYATQKMTARDLLSHRSGLPRHDLVWYGTNKSREELYKSLALLEPTTSFRGAWQYQNLMFMTAGYLVEKISGQSWEAFVQSNFFDPLAMKTANFSVEKMQQVDNFSQGFAYNAKEDKISQLPFKNIDAIGPAGSINASVSEMGNWMIMQLNKGKFGDKEVLGESYIKQMHTPHMVVPGDYNDEIFYRSYGLGWFITSYRGKVRIEHGGNIDGFTASVALYPQDSIGIVVLVNQNVSPANGAIRNTAYDMLMGMEKIDWNKKLLDPIKEQLKAQKKEEKQEDVVRKKNTKPSHPLEELAGTYVHEAYGTQEIILVNDTLKTLMAGNAYPFEHYHYNIFHINSPIGKLKATFSYNDQGDIDKVAIPLQAGVDPIVFSKKVEMEALTSEMLWRLYYHYSSDRENCIILKS